MNTKVELKKDNFLNVPLKIFNSSKGPIKLPMLFQDYGYTHFFFWVDYKKVALKLANTPFKACKFFNKKAGVLLSFFEYRQCAIGPYHEVGLTVLCHPKHEKKPGPFLIQLLKDAKKWTMGAYVVDLPVTTETAYVGGKEIWNYPKFVTEIVANLENKHFEGVVTDPDIQAPLLRLEGKFGALGPGMKLSSASFISYTVHKDKPLRILTESDAEFKVNLGFSSSLNVNNRSHHIMANNLRDMGLDGKKPFMVFYCERARMKLNEGIVMDYHANK